MSDTPMLPFEPTAETKHAAARSHRPARALARQTDPDTSHDAADSFTEKRLTEIQRDVLEWFRSVKRATDEQLEDALTSRYPAQTTVSKRRTDLVRMGLLRDSGERTKNRNNRNMIVWELAE